METRFGFTKMSVAEFATWLNSKQVARTVLYLQQHHTWRPNYSQFTGNNHFDLQRSMKNHHVNSNGWRDIGQHFSIFPDGTIVTGRSMELSPACILYNNANAICLEHIGDFDSGMDQMTAEHRNAIIAVSGIICKKFNIAINANRIVYHHWFDLGNGNRTNGTGSTKSCPGTGFFGGNKVADAEVNFFPLIQQYLNTGNIPEPSGNAPQNLLYYGLVNTATLNVRSGAGTNQPRIGATTLGAVIRVYDERNGWLKISNSREEWVFGNYVTRTTRATVNANVLNVRTGPGTNFAKNGTLNKGEEIFIVEEKNGWSKIAMEDKWVSSGFLTLG